VTISIAVVVALAIIGVLLARPERRPADGDRAASHPAAAPTTTPDIDVLLPLPKSQLAAAVKTATDFATAYATHRTDQGAATYLARLKPLTTPELHAALTRAAAPGGINTSRTRDRETTTPHAAPVKIRTVGPGSVIAIIDLTYETATTTATATATATATGGSRYTEQFAITAVTTDSTDSTGTWVISDVQLASAGNQGEIPGAAP
jgi:hypothetical protein